MHLFKEQAVRGYAAAAKAIPIIEIPHQVYRSGTRACVIKVDRLRHILCRISRGRRLLKNCIHTSSRLSLLLQPLSAELILKDALR